ncbi:hypothetical protein MKZ38_006290 [Zalerion maritima]|uniref:Uncharacterized protein n=1 Tax=Zalerion maritima TaxID=339359 RepID=A0AAD5WNI0_9PEZI|nr:hypothetical protein MKZ38_006290 [Zalerion maritima]
MPRKGPRTVNVDVALGLRPPPKKPGPKPKSFVDKQLKPRQPLVRSQQSYPKSRKIEVVLWMCRTRLPEPRGFHAAANVRVSAGAGHYRHVLDGMDPKGAAVFRPPSLAETYNFWKIPTATINQWWSKRDDLLANDWRKHDVINFFTLTKEQLDEIWPDPGKDVSTKDYVGDSPLPVKSVSLRSETHSDPDMMEVRELSPKELTIWIPKGSLKPGTSLRDETLSQWQLVQPTPTPSPAPNKASSHRIFYKPMPTLDEAFSEALSAFNAKRPPSDQFHPPIPGQAPGPYQGQYLGQQLQPLVNCHHPQQPPYYGPTQPYGHPPYPGPTPQRQRHPPPPNGHFHQPPPSQPHPPARPAQQQQRNEPAPESLISEEERVLKQHHDILTKGLSGELRGMNIELQNKILGDAIVYLVTGILPLLVSGKQNGSLAQILATCLNNVPLQNQVSTLSHALVFSQQFKQGGQTAGSSSSANTKGSSAPAPQNPRKHPLEESNAAGGANGQAAKTQRLLDGMTSTRRRAEEVIQRARDTSTNIPAVALVEEDLERELDALDATATNGEGSSTTQNNTRQSMAIHVDKAEEESSDPESEEEYNGPLWKDKRWMRKGRSPKCNRRNNKTLTPMSHEDEYVTPMEPHDEDAAVAAIAVAAASLAHNIENRDSDEDDGSEEN